MRISHIYSTHSFCIILHASCTHAHSLHSCAFTRVLHSIVYIKIYYIHIYTLRCTCCASIRGTHAHVYARTYILYMCVPLRTHGHAYTPCTHTCIYYACAHTCTRERMHTHGACVRAHVRNIARVVRARMHLCVRACGVQTRGHHRTCARGCVHGVCAHARVRVCARAHTCACAPCVGQNTGIFSFLRVRIQPVRAWHF